VNNCYFCHAPVFTDEVKIRIQELGLNDRGASKLYSTVEAAHPECLEAARVWFIEPELRRIPVSTVSREAPDR
jgi:hypothetical protein